MDRQWKQWKRRYLGSSNKHVHEPDVRKGERSFYCKGDTTKRKKAINALSRILSNLDFSAIVCVVDRSAYLDTFGDVPMDDSLPSHPYLMTLHFIAERIALALQNHFGGAKARIVMESRGELDDATLQYEFARLFLDGTTYISASWFRRMFLPGLEFKTKEDNITGLQLADLVARPCADKVMRPESTPARWSCVREKLCPGKMTEHSILGLKIVPWENRFAGVWES